MPIILALPDMRWLFAITGTNPATWRSDVHRGLSVAAFGVAEPVLESRPLALDAVAIHIRDDLIAGDLPRKLAGAIVRVFFDRWAEGIAHAEQDGQDVVFYAAELDPRKFGTDSNWRCGVGPADGFERHLASLPKPIKRVLFIHLLETLADIRRCAAEAGLDLSAGRFFVPPDHPLLAECKAEFETWRAENRVSGPRGKFPKVSQQRRRHIEGLLQ
jgi:hypothetical protein